MNRRRELQAAIAAVRQTTGEDYPRATMTRRQEGKGEATVNCGGAWGTPRTTAAMAQLVMEDAGFQAFLKRQNAAAVVEPVGIHYPYYRIRITFSSAETEERS